MTARPSVTGEPGPTRRPAILIITAQESADKLAAGLASRLSMTVEIASTRAAALRLLDRRPFAVVILDRLLAESDTECADFVWRRSGLAFPIEINFALAAPERVEREVLAVLTRRQREQELAFLAASAEVDAEIKDAVTKFLLKLQLALVEPGLSPPVESHLRSLLANAEGLRERLGTQVTPLTL
ncbi:MAG: hypothetical protein WA294_12900 [Acidobacteriaceae bacterium]